MDVIGNPDLRELLEGLLQKDPDRRWARIDFIKNCRWLRNVNWKMIEEKRVKVPCQPSLYHSYIVEELKEEQHNVDIMNQYEEDTFEPLFEFFNFVKPDSREAILGPGAILETPVSQASNIPARRQKSRTAKSKKSNNMSITAFDKENYERRDHSPNIVEARTSKHCEAPREPYFKELSRSKRTLKASNATTYLHGPGESLSRDKDIRRKSVRLAGQVSCKNLLGKEGGREKLRLHDREDIRSRSK